MPLQQTAIKEEQPHPSGDENDEQEEEGQLPGSLVLGHDGGGLVLQRAHLAVQRGLDVVHLALNIALHLHLQSRQSLVQGAVDSLQEIKFVNDHHCKIFTTHTKT